MGLRITWAYFLILSFVSGLGEGIVGIPLVRGCEVLLAEWTRIKLLEQLGPDHHLGKSLRRP